MMEAHPAERHDHEALARLLVIALEKEPKAFKLTAPRLLTAVDASAGMMLQLFRLEDESKPYDPETSTLPSFLNDLESHGGRHAREERFSAICKVG